MKRKVWIIGLILLLVTGVLTSAIPKPAADTQNGFIFVSAGTDGKFGTNDDICITESGNAIQGKVDPTDGVFSAVKP